VVICNRKNGHAVPALHLRSAHLVQNALNLHMRHLVCCFIAQLRAPLPLSAQRYCKGGVCHSRQLGRQLYD